MLGGHPGGAPGANPMGNIMQPGMIGIGNNIGNSRGIGNNAQGKPGIGNNLMPPGGLNVPGGLGMPGQTPKGVGQLFNIGTLNFNLPGPNSARGR
jgi:hypothetical protein